MSALVRQIGQAFSDFWLDIELFFGGLFHKNNNNNHTEAPKVLGRFIAQGKIKPLEKISFSLRYLWLSNRQLLFFYDQLETLISSGVTLIDSLLIIQAQSTSKRLTKLYEAMIHHINAGLGLAETMSLYSHVFPSMHSALIEAGEKSGNLKKVLSQIVISLENQLDFMRKIKSAMFYPIVLMVLALTMVTGMMLFVIPKVADLYKQSNARLPALTQAVIDLSHFMSANYLFIFGGVFIAIILFYFLIRKTAAGRYAWETVFSFFPVFGQIEREKNLMIFASNLGMLLDSGVLISDAFEITEKTMGSLHYRRALKEIRQGIVLGKTISQMMGLEDIKARHFKKNRLFPLQVAQLIHIGEVTGAISAMLGRIQKNYYKSVDYKLKNISTMIEPLMIFFVALIVGSILLAVMLPFFYIGTTIN